MLLFDMKLSQIQYNKWESSCHTERTISIPRLTVANKLLTSLYYDVIKWSQNKNKASVSFCQKLSDFEGKGIRKAIIIPYFSICDRQSCICRSKMRLRSPLKCTIDCRKIILKHGVIVAIIRPFFRRLKKKRDGLLLVWLHLMTS